VSAFDFTEFAEPNLQLPLHGHVYSCPPPSVADAAVILALHVRARVQLGLDDGPVDPEVLALIEAKAGDIPLAVLTLGQDVYDALVAAGESPTTINRMGYYAMLFWARGEQYAIELSRLLWTTAGQVGEVAPKAPRPSKSGRSTGSGSRTRTASTRTTGSPQT